MGTVLVSVGCKHSSFWSDPTHMLGKQFGGLECRDCTMSIKGKYRKTDPRVSES